MDRNSRQQKVEVMLERMRQGFVSELAERCDELEGMVLELQNCRGDDALLNRLFREVHSVKGIGGIMGFALVSSVCHQFESYIVGTRAAGGPRAEVGLRFVDMIRRVIELAAEMHPDFTTVERELEMLRRELLCNRHQVLVLEASRMMSDLYREVMKDFPVDLEICESGLVGLGLLVRNGYDVLIVAEELTDLNGRAVLRALRASNSRNQKIPAVFIGGARAGDASRSEADVVIEQGAELPVRLGDAVGRLLEQRRRAG